MISCKKEKYIRSNDLSWTSWTPQWVYCKKWLIYAIYEVMKMTEGVHDGVQDVQAVIEWLEQVRKLDELINAKLTERDQLMDMATKITPDMSDTPHGSGVTDKVGNAATMLADLAKDIDCLVDEYVDRKLAVVAALEKLPPFQYGALHRYYIRYMTWEDVAEDMGRSYMQVMRYKKKGLRKLANVIECYTIPMV